MSGHLVCAVIYVCVTVELYHYGMPGRHTLLASLSDFIHASLKILDRSTLPEFHHREFGRGNISTAENFNEQTFLSLSSDKLLHEDRFRV
ncbi:hypothetical protein BDW22DRAFT_18025 [Trametopsis cervina]|nr:hypothetical protein BDW22DRAFT_18025 [Trametopsis cervina]